MRTLVLDRLPVDVTALKNERKEYPIIGETVHDSSFVTALERYGTYDEYFYVLNNPFAPVRRRSARIRPLPADALDQLRRRDDVVLFTSGLHLSKYAPLRAALGRPHWPLCGLTHSLADTCQLLHYLSMGVLSSLHEHDAIVCSTIGARQTMVSIFEAVARSRSLRAGTVRVPPVQLPIIPLGVEINESEREDRASARRRLTLDETAPVFFTLGRLSPTNKADVLPLVFGFLTNDGLPSGSTLIVAGDDAAFSLADSIRSAAASIESDKRVRVMPNVTSAEKNALFSAADVYLGISDTFEETFGIAIVEAMLHGLPVVAADWEGFRHLVTHDREGLLVPTLMPLRGTAELSALMNVFPFLKYVLCQRVALDAGALRQALAALARDGELRRRLGTAARARAVATYGWRTVIGQFEQLWDDLLTRGRALPASASSQSLAAFFDYGEAFRHYATEIVSDDCQLELTPLGAALATTPNGSALQRLKAPYFFSSDLDTTIVAVLAGAGCMTFGELADRVAREGHADYVVTSHIGRLVKYGIARPSALLGARGAPMDAVASSASG